MSRADKKRYDSMMNLPVIPELPEHELTVCNNCGENDFDIVDDCVYICFNCGAEMMQKLLSDHHIDSSRIQINSKQVYNRGDNFEKVIRDFLKFQDVDEEVILNIQNDFEILVSKFEKERKGRNFPNLKYTMYRLLLKNKVEIKGGYFKEKFFLKSCPFLDKYL
jgi:hypothetical protein